MSGPGRLTVIETHPVQYRAPLYRRLQQRHGIPVTVLYGSRRGVAAARDPGFGVPVRWDTDLLSGYDACFLSGAGRLRLGRTLARIGPAAVLLTGYASPVLQAGFFAASRLKIPILFRAETTDVGRAGDRLRGWSRDWALRQLYRRCAAFLYIGDRSREHYRRLGCPEERLVFSPYGVDGVPFESDERARERLRERTRAALKIPADGWALLFSGKLIPEKEPGLILRACRRLSDPLRRRVVLIWMGDGRLRTSLEADSAGAPAVESRFLGFKNQKEMSPVYHAADGLVLPSRRETWGLVVNEALQHGLPCAVSDGVGCAPDLVIPGRTGEIFPAGSADGLAAALTRLGSFREEAAARAVRRGTVEGYSLERAAEGIAEAVRRFSGSGAR